VCLRFFLIGYGIIVERSLSDSGQSGMSTTTRSSFPFSPAAIVLSLSFLRRWQVKRPIRAGQRGRAYHSPSIPNSIEKKRYLIERLFSERWECLFNRGETYRDRNIGRVRNWFDCKIRDATYAYERQDCILPYFLILKIKSFKIFL